MSEDDTFGKASEKDSERCVMKFSTAPEMDVLLQSGSDGLTSRCSVLLLSSFGPIAPPPPLRARQERKRRHRHELADIGTIGNRNSRASGYMHRL